MRTIVSPKKNIHVIIGKQGYDKGITYRPIKYIIAQEVKDGCLVCNGMTREVILFTKEEYEEFKNGEMEAAKAAALIRGWFYVPQGVDEKSVYYLLRQEYLYKNPKPRGRSRAYYVIFTTTNCNANCPYCYEKNIERIDMSREVAADAAKYIERSRIQSANAVVSLKWFGGEPLMNSEAMDIICGHMKGAGIAYKSSITTNGYLLDQFTDEHITSLWRLKHAQITLDGTEESYNSIKNIACDGSAFQKVLGNIKRLLALGVKVVIRMNISKDNGEDLLALVDYLNSEIDGKENLSAYSYVIFDEAPTSWTDKERDAAISYFEKIQKSIANHGFSTYGGGFPTIHAAHCMADDNRGVCINPIGGLTPCEHHAWDNIIGNIYDGITERSILEGWGEKCPESDLCKSCKLFPMCITLKKCPAFAHGCDKFIRVRLENTVKYNMLKAYEHFLKERDNEQGHRTGRVANRVCGRTREEKR